MGMSRRGELARLAEIARPDVGLVTRVSRAHLEFFASVDEIALAKRELIEGLNGRESTAVLNADDPRVAAFGAFAPGRVLTYGIEKQAFFMAQDIEVRGALGSAFDYVSPEGRVRLELNVPGRHAIANALAAVAGGLPRARAIFFATPQEAAEFLSGLIVPGDLLLVKGSRGVKMEQIVETLIARHAAPGEITGQEVRH